MPPARWVALIPVSEACRARHRQQGLQIGPDKEVTHHIAALLMFWCPLASGIQDHRRAAKVKCGPA